MVTASLKEALRLVTGHAVMWIPGIICALFTIADLNLEYYGGTFITGKIWVLEIIVMPFLLAGLFYAIRQDDYSIRSFFGNGARGYFRVLLPGVIILFAALLTALLLLIPLTLIGTPGTMMSLYASIAVGVAVPFIFLMYFYDAVAIFGEEKVFESIRKSIELTMRNTGLVIKFFLVNILVIIAVFFVVFIAWTSVFLDQLTPLTTMNATELETITPDFFISLLGQGGIFITSIIFAIGTLLLVTVLLAYKACFYRVLSGSSQPTVQVMQGEYDEKGRWYKY